MNTITKPSIEISHEQIDAAIARARVARSEKFHEIVKGAFTGFSGLFGNGVSAGRPAVS